MVKHKRNALKDKKINVKRWPRKIPNLWLWQIKQLLYFNWHTYSSLRLDGWMRSCYLLNTQHTNLQFSLSKSETYTYSTYGNTRAHTHSHTHTHTHIHTHNRWKTNEKNDALLLLAQPLFSYHKPIAFVC